MDTTTLAAFWEGVASTSANMIFSNTTWWILLGQVVLILCVLGALFIVLRKGIGKAVGFKGRSRWRR